MQLLYPALATGFVLVAAPLLIHLIHMVRQRRQPWAAMEFLVAAYRRQRKWILLRQLLLLLARTAAMFLLVALLAGWVSNQQWLSFLGEQTTHHICILDDSLSMADRSGGESAYARALAALDGLERNLAASPGDHRLTLLRTSRAAVLDERSGPQAPAADAAVDLSAQTVAASGRLLERLRATAPTDLAARLDAALDLVPALADSVTADQTRLLLLTDMRKQDWDRPERLLAALRSLQQQSVMLQVVDCGQDPQTNLSVVELAPEPDVWAAGVPLMVRVSVRNHGTVPVRNVVLSAAVARSVELPVSPALDRAISGRREALPDILIEQIEPGQSVLRRFQVFVPESGTHAVEVQLPDDVLQEDNRRFCLLPLVTQRRVLVVDGDPAGRNAFLLSAALDPGGAVQTGLKCETQPASFLQSANLSALRGFDAIYLLDVPTIDLAAGKLLQAYVAEGHGLAIWLGQQARIPSYEAAFGPQGAGLLSGQLRDSAVLETEGERTAPDVTFGEDHPITEALATGGDSVFARVRVGRHVPLQIDESLAPTPQVLLKLRNGAPMLTFQRLPRGGIAVLTVGLDNQSSNWPSDPTFVVLMLRLAAQLSAGESTLTELPVGATWQVTCDLERLNPRAIYVPPVDQPPRMEFDLPAVTVDSTVGSQWRISPREALMENTIGLDSMLRSGLAELWTKDVEGRDRLDLMAWTVSPDEGLLERTTRNEFAQRVAPLSIRWSDAAILAGDQEATGTTRSLWLLGLLGGLLIGEQLLGYLASYHPPRAKRTEP
jgi:hypothetical protein